MAVPPLSILVVNPSMPRPDRDAGSLRLNRLLLLMAEAGHDVTVIARMGVGDEPCALALEAAGIEVHRVDPERLAERGIDLTAQLPPLDLERLLTDGRFDVAILSFWELAEQYTPIIRRVSPLTRIVVDTVDVHWVREHRGAEIAGDAAGMRAAEATRVREGAAYAATDALIAVTEPDADALRAMAPDVPVHIIGTIHDPEPRGPRFADRSGAVFVGSFNHTPNGDAAHFLAAEVWPRVRAAVPGAELAIVGTNPSPEIQALAGDGITVTGWVPEVRPYLDAARVSVAPLRFGAGLKGKIGEALGAGLPVVTTSIGAEGMELVDGETALIAETADDLAAAIVRLHADADLWERVADAGHAHIGATLGSGVARRALDAMLTAVAPQTFLAPRDLDVAGATELLRGYFAAFAETDQVSLLVPGGAEMFDVLVTAIGALGRDPEHIPDLNVSPVPADALLPRAMRTAGDWTTPPVAPRAACAATLVVRAGDDAEAFAAQIEALAAAGLPDDVQVLVVGERVPGIEGATVVEIPDWLGRRAAVQRAVATARGDVVVVLEPLVLPHPGFLAPLVAAVTDGAAFAAPVVDGAHGYRIHDDGSLWPCDAHTAATALAFDALAARRATWLASPAALPVVDGHREVQLAAWAADRGGVAVAHDAHVTRAAGEPASVVVCTRDRADELPECIALLVASGARDVVIVDNGSTDATPELAAELAERHPGIVRVVSEPIAGLSRARNTGADAARHDILLYLDDDARPGPGWLQRIAHALSRPGVVHAGGPIAGLWPASRPDGWPGAGREPLLSILDLGDADVDLGGERSAYGANWCVRREALRTIGGFDDDVGLRPGHSVNGDEIVPFRRLEQLPGTRSRYVALGAVGHRIDPGRVSDEWLFRRLLTTGLESPQVHVRVAGTDPQILRRDLRRAGLVLLGSCPVAGDLTLEEAFAAITSDPRPLEDRRNAVYALGLVTGCSLLLGEQECVVGALNLTLRPEHLSGQLAPRLGVS